jgi:hypothetical protein
MHLRLCGGQQRYWLQRNGQLTCSGQQRYWLQQNGQLTSYLLTCSLKIVNDLSIWTVGRRNAQVMADKANMAVFSPQAISQLPSFVADTLLTKRRRKCQQQKQEIRHEIPQLISATDGRTDGGLDHGHGHK